MKSAVFFVLLSALHACADLTLKPSKPNFVRDAYIMETYDTPTLHRRGGALHPLDAVYHDLKSRDIQIQVTKEFKDKLFQGAAVIVKNPEDLALIKRTPGVKAFRPMRIFSPPKPVQHHILNGRDDPNISPNTFSTHVLGGVDKVHAEGNIGTGVKIALIDTGVDYTNPVLGSNGFGPGKKIVVGYDFVGNDFNSSDPHPQPKPDPMDCMGHGTHVAGIISAEPGNSFNLSGVAYGATIGAYKIFGCNQGTTEDVIIEALLQAVKDGMDIVNMSFDNVGGWSSASVSVVADRIAKSGKIVVVSAGNSGTSGAWYASDPATGQDVISVGSVDNTVIPLQNATVNGVDHPIPYLSILPLKIDGSLPIYATSTNTSIADDACSPLPDDTPGLSKYLVVIRRGGCSFTTKLGNAAAKGAKSFFIYDNGTGFAPIAIGNYTAALILPADGMFLVKEFIAGTPITISFPQVGSSWGLPEDHGGLMSAFSNYGPTNELGFYPSISAPGESVLSTIPVVNGTFAVMSGTSMAAPFVAGSSALLLAAKGKTSSVATGARTLFETTSTKILASKNDTAFDTLIKTGAGLINVYNAIHATTIVSPGQLILNDTAHFQGNHIINIENTADASKQYILKHTPALTALTMKPNAFLPALGPVPLVSSHAAVDIVPSTVTVPSGTSVKVMVSFNPPTGLDSSLYPIYSGFIEVTSGESESYHVSYMGLAASLRDHKLFDNSTAVLPFATPALTNQNGTVLTQPTNFTFNATTGSTNYPVVLWRLLMGTVALRIDLVDPNIQVMPACETDAKVVGNLYSKDYVSRNNEAKLGTEDSNGYIQLQLNSPRFANGTAILNGQYRILVRALRITGDQNSEDDYDSWLSSIIGIDIQ